MSALFTTLWSGIKTVWTTVSGWFNTNVITLVKTAWETATSAIGGLWTSIKTGVVSAMNAVIGGIESGINFIVRGINKIIGGFNKIVSWAAKVPEIDWGGVDTVPEVSLTRIPAFATGGFPEDGLFMANHDKLVSKFSNEKNAVANNQQITEGIRQAAYLGMK